jgi:hypothetical protein
MGDWTRGRSGRATPTPAELAWIAALPCALIALAAILALGPPLGHLLFPRPSAADALWPPHWEESQGHPVPTKQARYILAALAPLLLGAAIVAGARRAPQLGPAAIRVLVRASQLALLAFVALALLGQYGVVLSHRKVPHVFGYGALATAAVLVAGALLALRRPGVARRLAALARETAARRRIALAVAAAASLIWLAQGIYTDALAQDIGTLDWTVNDAFAVLNGRTPLVDFHILYAKLLPYPTAAAMALFGTTALVYTLLTTALSLLALLALYAVLRRIVRSSLLALGLFVPVLALGDLRHTMAETEMWPMRYGTAYLMAWLTARHIDGAWPRRAWVLSLIGGLLAIDELEFGMAALAATVVALLCTRPPRSARAAWRLAGELAAGALAAVAIVVVATLARAGALPDPALLEEWPRIFSRLGWFTLSMPIAGLHLAIYATLAAAIATAAARIARGAPDALLTGMLAWSGVFGLVAGVYYAGRSDTVKLVSMFSAWGFALALLTVVVVRTLAARGWRRPSLAHLLVLFGFALAICSIVRAPSPLQQIRRLTQSLPPPVYHQYAVRFVRANARPGERVALLLPMSDRIAYDLQLDDVAPYGTEEALVTRWQIRTLLDQMHREGAHTLFLKEGRISTAQLELLSAEGFHVVASQRAQATPIGFMGFIAMSDA